eukprot:CAMPEP_0202965520 /NCGR_PEP_ID=MMETSP1396-20130829/9466_1 /ASSEMBLY_ACC=CAM_ASM_000872 /TAXON_ID= /ORGANISM="Pseudokeronopsis sp., Strain Brazil" /LENGTH=38 /DNA_ID= /DNA_START= /DNA_END= /DNA_ORIENTATION=
MEEEQMKWQHGESENYRSTLVILPEKEKIEKERQEKEY